ncbi:MAG TPA: GNAT family N-acetyltransferase [Gammaproteobacteria bacterium]|nr:GNAT family N-acetyltransferase [Gammaproteobacteria bacterium]
MRSEVELRLGTLADAAEIGAMSRDLVETGLGWSWTVERVARSIRHADTTVLVAEDGIRIAGFAIMYFGFEEARLNLLAVRPAYRRLGLGRRLLRWLEASALVAGVAVVYLEARAGNCGAQAFYGRLGYRTVAQLPGYYRGLEAGVRMARDLWCASPSGSRNTDR